MSTPDRELPEPNRVPQNCDSASVLPLEAVYGVYSWGPGRDGEGPSTQVHFVTGITLGGDAPDRPPIRLRPTVRLKSARAVDELIAALKRHRADVWPGERVTQ